MPNPYLLNISVLDKWGLVLIDINGGLIIYCGTRKYFSEGVFLLVNYYVLEKMHLFPAGPTRSLQEIMILDSLPPE